MPPALISVVLLIATATSPCEGFEADRVISKVPSQVPRAPKMIMGELQKMGLVYAQLNKRAPRPPRRYRGTVKYPRQVTRTKNSEGKLYRIKWAMRKFRQRARNNEFRRLVKQMKQAYTKGLKILGLHVTPNTSLSFEPQGTVPSGLVACIEDKACKKKLKRAIKKGKVTSMGAMHAGLAKKYRALIKNLLSDPKYTVLKVKNPKGGPMIKRTVSAKILLRTAIKEMVINLQKRRDNKRKEAQKARDTVLENGCDVQ